MTEERAVYTVESKVVAVRLEHFRREEGNWQSFLRERLFARYPGAKIVSKRPQVAVIELRTSGAWSPEDEAFFARMRTDGYFQRWEPLPELPPQPKRNRAVYEDIGYRIGEGEPLTRPQQEALFSQLQDLEAHAEHAEDAAEAWRTRAEHAEEFSAETATTYNEIIGCLGEELRMKVYHQGDGWIAEDAESGKILLRDVALPMLYRKALRLRLEKP